MYKYFAIIIVLLVAGGCKKDSPAPIEQPSVSNCSDFTGCDNSFAINYYDSTQFQSPCVNPNNANEFIYIYKNSNTPLLNGLYKYNISNNTKQKLSSLNTFSHPKWGKNNWILFSAINGDNREIFKIKSNGDSLTQLTAGYPDLFPEWDNKNNRIIFNRQIYLGSPSSKIIITDLNGNLLDSIDNKYFHNGSCNTIAELALPPFSKRECGISVVSSENKAETLLIEPIKCENKNQGICWHPNNLDIYYTTYYGSLFKINKSTKEQSIIKSFCDTKTYGAVSVSPNGDFLLVERIDARQINCNPWYKSTIYKVSTDGISEIKIVME
jgi:hypothetical protein